jgi:hypothetical protein
MMMKYINLKANFIKHHKYGIAKNSGQCLADNISPQQVNYA